MLKKVSQLLRISGIFSFSLFTILLLNGCGIESKIARQFTDARPQGAVLLFTPGFVFKTNLKEDSIKNLAQFSGYERDSVLIENSIYLKELSDSAVLVNYINSYIEGLKSYGLEVFTEEYIQLFLEYDTTAYTVNIAQIELEEYVYEIEDRELLGFDSYKIDFDLNAINYNSWFEINKVNEENPDKTLLFASHFVSDDLYGEFTQYIFTGEVNYNYTIDSITNEKILDLASYLGGLYAEYTYDYILNRYIYRNMPDERQPRYYIHYDKNTGRFRDADEDRFEIIYE